MFVKVFDPQRIVLSFAKIAVTVVRARACARSHRRTLAHSDCGAQQVGGVESNSRPAALLLPRSRSRIYRVSTVLRAVQVELPQKSDCLSAVVVLRVVSRLISCSKM